MINYKLLEPQSILVVMPVGKVGRNDFDALVQDIDHYLLDHERLQGLMVCSEYFHGWEDFAAMLSHLRFVRSQHRHIDRVAVVTDSKVMGLMPHLVRHFARSNVRHFPYQDQSAALAWLEH